jgi:outer membrane protein assembly factor BamE (lipoprotein component of BamABCDE complex)
MFIYFMFMKKYLLIIFGFFLISNCSLNKVVKHHGVHFLEKKQEKLILNISNKNDIVKLLGSPSTTSTFDEDLWIYIERNTSSSRLSKLGKKKLLTSDVLVLELNSRGILSKKLFINKNNIQKIKFSDEFTKMSLTKQSYVYDFLNSMRQKINDPLNKKSSK